MSFKSKNIRYTNRFLGHFKRFIEEYCLFERDEPLLIAASGGIDSMVLVFCLYSLRGFGYSNNLRVVHINHQTRTGQDKEQQFVMDFCEHLGIECRTVSLSNLNPDKNFEYTARLKRYDAFYEIANDNEKIILAHHIDDSFEWTMLQSLRSSSIEGLIGIPVVNRRVIRPFMCVTKEQIRKFSHFFDIPYLEDPTNDHLKYERNFIRHNVIGAFKDRYSKYLKHYVFRHNEISRRLGLHYINKNKSSFRLNLGSQGVIIYSLSGKEDYSGIQELILKGLKYLNPDSRGSVVKQIQTIVTGMKNNKYGPVSLTNGVQVYLDFQMILMTKKNIFPSKKSTKLELPLTYQKMNFDQFGNYISEFFSLTDAQLDFPFYVVVKNSRLDKRNFKTTFNIEVIKHLQQCNLTYYPALKLRREWSKKKNRHEVLQLCFI